MRHCLFTFVSLVLLAAPAAADETSRTAREHVARAKVLHEQQRFADALAALEAAYALDPQPKLLFAMGQLHVKVGRCDHAIARYREFLQSEPPADAREVVTEAIASCEALIATLQRENRWPPREGDAPTPPAHADAAPPVASTSPTATRGPAVTSERVVSEPARTEPRSWYSDRVGVGLLAGGAASALASALVYRSALGDRDAATDAATYDRYEQLLDRAGTKRTYAVVLGVTGAAIVTAGVVRVVRGQRVDDDRGLNVQVGPKRGMVTWTGGF